MWNALSQKVFTPSKDFTPRSFVLVHRIYVVPIIFDPACLVVNT